MTVLLRGKAEHNEKAIRHFHGVVNSGKKNNGAKAGVLICSERLFERENESRIKCTLINPWNLRTIRGNIKNQLSGDKLPVN